VRAGKAEGEAEARVSRARWWRYDPAHRDQLTAVSVVDYGSKMVGKDAGLGARQRLIARK